MEEVRGLPFPVSVSAPALKNPAQEQMLRGLSDIRYCNVLVYLGCELPRWGRNGSFDRWTFWISWLGQWLLQQCTCWILLFHLTRPQQHCKKPLAGSSENSDNLAFFKLHLFKTPQYLVQTLTFFPGWVKHLSSKIWQKENKTNKTVVLWKHKDFFYLSLKDHFLVSLIFILFKEL